MSAESIWKDLKRLIYLSDDDFVEQMRGKLDERDEDTDSLFGWNLTGCRWQD